MNDTDIKISVIVPAYNVGEYLSECIDSVLRQNYAETELILIDDGSTDNTGSICDEYSRRDSRITVVHQSNSGVSTARNVGIARITGEYVLFLDGDDYLSDGLFDKLAAIIRDNPGKDLYSGGFCYLESDKTAYTCIKIGIAEGQNNGKFSNLKILYSRENGIMSLLCRHLMKRKTIVNNGLSFNPDYPSGQDRDFIFRFILASSSFTQADIPFFYRRLNRPGSIRTEFTPKSLMSNIRLEYDWYEYFHDQYYATGDPTAKYLANQNAWSYLAYAIKINHYQAERDEMVKSINVYAFDTDVINDIRAKFGIRIMKVFSKGGGILGLSVLGAVFPLYLLVARAIIRIKNLA